MILLNKELYISNQEKFVLSLLTFHRKWRGTDFVFISQEEKDILLNAITPSTTWGNLLGEQAISTQRGPASAKESNPEPTSYEAMLHQFMISVFHCGCKCCAKTVSLYICLWSPMLKWNAATLSFLTQFTLLITGCNNRHVNRVIQSVAQIGTFCRARN